MGPDAMILVFWMLSFKPTFSLSSFTFIKRFFSSLLSAIRVVSSAYLRLLIFLPAILIPTCASTVHGVARQEGIPSALREGQPFCSVHAFDWSDGAHPQKGGQSAFWSLLFQMLISSRNAQNVWAPCCGPVKLTHKISHHICQTQKKNTIRTSQFYQRPAGSIVPPKLWAWDLLFFLLKGRLASVKSAWMPHWDFHLKIIIQIVCMILHMIIICIWVSFPLCDLALHVLP